MQISSYVDQYHFYFTCIQESQYETGAKGTYGFSEFRATSETTLPEPYILCQDFVYYKSHFCHQICHRRRYTNCTAFFHEYFPSVFCDIFSAILQYRFQISPCRLDCFFVDVQEEFLHFRPVRRSKRTNSPSFQSDLKDRITLTAFRFPLLALGCKMLAVVGKKIVLTFTKLALCPTKDMRK